ncbi:MAG: hypothetical protein ACLPVP_01825 [Methanoregula sp.]
MSGSNLYTNIRKILVFIVVLSAMQMTAHGGVLTSSFSPMGSVRAGTPDIRFGDAVSQFPMAVPDSSASTTDLLARGGGGHGGGGHGGGGSGGGGSGGGGSGGGGSGGGGHGGGNNQGGNNQGGNNQGGNNQGGNNQGGNNQGGNNQGGYSGGNRGQAQTGTQNGGSYFVAVGVQGSTVSSAGNSNQITINVQEAQRSGEKISQQNNAISLEKGPVVITVTTQSAPVVNNGQISAGITSISMQSYPVTAQFAGKGLVSATFHSEMNNMPPGDAAIGFSLFEQPDTHTMTLMESTVNDKGYRLDAVAYTAQVEKTDLGDKAYIGQSVVTMDIAPSWVLNHGGISGVKIFRLADDGTSQLLDTKFSGLDNSFNMVFTGESPGGLSMFALVSVAPQKVTVAPTTSSVISITSLTPSETSVILIPPLVLFIALVTLRRK